MARVTAFEDNAIVLLEITDSLLDNGHELLGSAASVDKACELLHRHIDEEIVIDIIIQDACGKNDSEGEFAKGVVDFMHARNLRIPILGLSAMSFSNFDINFGDIPFRDIGKANIARIGEIVTETLREFRY